MAADSFKLMRRKSSAVSDLSSDAMRIALIGVFTEADKDSSGSLDRPQLTGLLSSLGVQLLNPIEDIDAIFEAVDTDGDGNISTVEFCTKFEPAIKRLGSSMMGKMDLDIIMKETFDKMLVDARDQRTAVNRSFMQAREDCQEWFCKKFLGSKWRMKLFEAFYTNGGNGSESRLAHLRKSLDEAIKGKNTWVLSSLESDMDFKREVLDTEGVCSFSDKWLIRLEAELATISAKRLQSSETDRAPSVASDGRLTSVASDGGAGVDEAFGRLAVPDATAI